MPDSAGDATSPNASVLDVKITTLAAGQPRAYADSEYRYRIEFTFQPPLLGEPKVVRWTGDNLKQHAAQYAWARRGGNGRIKVKANVVPGWSHESFLPEWHEGFIAEVREIAPGVAEVLIIEPYID